MSWYYGPTLAELAGHYGVHFLEEILGNEALNPPTNTQYRIPDGYNPTLERLLLFRNGMFQHLAAGHYAETDARLITMAATLWPIDRLLALSIIDDMGQGGLVAVDRPPTLAGGGVPWIGPYDVSAPFDADELLVFLNDKLLVDGVGYNSDVANQQFSFMGGPVPVPRNICAVVIRKGPQGMIWRETQLGLGPFPANIILANTMDRTTECILLFINGQLQAETYDFNITDPNTIAELMTILGANDTEIISIASSNAPAWRH